MANKKTKTQKNKKKQRINIDFNFMRRKLAAYFIDFLMVTWITNVPIIYIYSVVTQQIEVHPNFVDFPGMSGYIAYGLGFLLALIYLIAMPLYKKSGQTLGKKLMRLKIVRYDNQDVTFKNMFLREVIGTCFIEQIMYAPATYVCTTILSIYLPNLVVYWYNAAFAIMIFSIFFSMFKKKQMLHDLVSNTKVILLPKS